MSEPLDELSESRDAAMEADQGATRWSDEVNTLITPTEPLEPTELATQPVVSYSGYPSLGNMPTLPGLYRSGVEWPDDTGPETSTGSRHARPWISAAIAVLLLLMLALLIGGVAALRVAPAHLPLQSSAGSTASTSGNQSNARATATTRTAATTAATSGGATSAASPTTATPTLTSSGEPATTPTDTAPRVSVSPTATTAQCVLGSYPSVTVSNTGGKTLSWSVSVSDSHVQVSPSGGSLAPSTSQTLTVSGISTAAQVVLTFDGSGGKATVTYTCTTV